MLRKKLLIKSLFILLLIVGCDRYEFEDENQDMINGWEKVRYC